jgi:hypothetical protein
MMNKFKKFKSSEYSTEHIFIRHKTASKGVEILQCERTTFSQELQTCFCLQEIPDARMHGVLNREQLLYKLSLKLFDSGVTSQSSYLSH